MQTQKLETISCRGNKVKLYSNGVVHNAVETVGYNRTICHQLSKEQFSKAWNRAVELNKGGVSCG